MKNNKPLVIKEIKKLTARQFGAMPKRVGVRFYNLLDLNVLLQIKKRLEGVNR